MTEKASRNSRNNKAWNSDFWLEELSKLSDSHALKSDCWNTSATIVESEQEKRYVKDDWDSDIDQEENEQQDEKDKELVDLDDIHIDWSLSDDDEKEQNDDNSQYNNNNNNNNNNTRDTIGASSLSSPRQQQQQNMDNETTIHFKTGSSLKDHQQQEKRDLHISTMRDKEKDCSANIVSPTSQEKKSDEWPINGWSASTSTSLVDIEPISMKLTPVLTPTPIVAKKSPTSTTETAQILLNDFENDQKIVDVIPQSSIKLCTKQSIGSLDFSLLDSGDDGNDDDDDEGDEDDNDGSSEKGKYQEEGTKVVGVSISNEPLPALDNNDIHTDVYENDNKLSTSQQSPLIQHTNIQTDYENVDPTLIFEKSETAAKTTSIQMDTIHQTKEVHTSPSEKDQASVEINPLSAQNVIVNHDDKSSTVLSVEESTVEREAKKQPTLEDDFTTVKTTSNPSTAVVEIKSQLSTVTNQSLTPSSSSSSSSTTTTMTTGCIHDSVDEDRIETIPPTKLDLSGEDETDSSRSRTLSDDSALLEQQKKEEIVQQIKEDTTVTVMQHMDNGERKKSIEKEQMNVVQNSTVSDASNDNDQEKIAENIVNEEKESSINVDTLLLKDQERLKEDKGESESSTCEDKLPTPPSVEKSSLEWESSTSIWAKTEENTNEKPSDITTATISQPPSFSKSGPEIKDQEQGSAFSIWAQPAEKAKEEESVVMISTASSAILSSKVEQEGTKLSMWAPPEEMADERLVVTARSTLFSPKIEQQATIIEQSGSEEKNEQQKRSAMTFTTSSPETDFSGFVENQPEEARSSYAAVDTKVTNQDRGSSCSSPVSTEPTGTIASIWSPVRRTAINMSKPQEGKEKKPVSLSTQQPTTTNTSSIRSPAPPAKRVVIQRKEQPSLSSPKNQVVHVTPSNDWSPASSPTIQKQQIVLSPVVQQQKATANESIWAPAPPAKSISIKKEQNPLPHSREHHSAKIHSSTSWSTAPSSSSSTTTTAVQEEQISLSSSTQTKLSTTDDSIWSPAPPTRSITIQQETKNPMSFTLQATAPEFSWNLSETVKTTTTIPSSTGQEQGQGSAATSAPTTAATAPSPAIVSMTKKRGQQQNIATDWSSSAASIWNPKTSETIVQQEPLSTTTPRPSLLPVSNQDDINTEKPLTFDYQLHKIHEEDSDEEDAEEEEEEEESDSEDDDDDDEEEYESGSEYNSDSDDNSVEQITINLASLVQAKKEEQKKKEPPVIRCTLSDLILGIKSEKIRNILDELSGKTTFANVSPSATTMTTTTTATTAPQEEREEQGDKKEEEQQQNGIHFPSPLLSTTHTSLSSVPPPSVLETKIYTHEQHPENKKEPALASLDSETKRKILEKAEQFDNNLKLNAFAPTFTPPTFGPESITAKTTLLSTDYKQSDSEGENVEDEEVLQYDSEQEEEHQQKESVATVSLPYNQHLTPQQQADLLSTPKYFESDDQPQQGHQTHQYTPSNTIQYYPKPFIPSVLSTPAALSQHPSLTTRIHSNSSMMTSVVNNNHHSSRSTDPDINYSTFNKHGTLYFHASGSPSSPSLATANSDTHNNNAAPLLKTPTSTKIKISAPDSTPSFSAKSNTDKFNISAPTFNPPNFRP